MKAYIINCINITAHTLSTQEVFYTILADNESEAIRILEGLNGYNPNHEINNVEELCNIDDLLGMDIIQLYEDLKEYMENAEEYDDLFYDAPEGDAQIDIVKEMFQSIINTL